MSYQELPLYQGYSRLYPMEQDDNVPTLDALASLVTRIGQIDVTQQSRDVA